MKSLIKRCFSSLNVNKMVDNKSSWETVKPFFSNKTVSSETITILDDDEPITDEQKVASTLNDYYSNIVTSLNLPESQNAGPLSDNIDHPTLKAIVKWRNIQVYLLLQLFMKIGRGLHSVLLYSQMLQKRLIS